MVLKLAQRFLPQGRFARRLTILSGGTTLGQGLLILSSPLLTRLFEPEEFGVLAVFSAIAAILCQVTALRYEVALPVLRRDEDAAAMAVAGSLSALVWSLVFALVLALFENPLAARLGIPGFGHVLWLMPPMLLTWGLSLVLAHWSIRRGSFKVNAAGNLAMSASQAAGQLASGAIHATAMSLTFGYILGSLIRCACLLTAPSRADWGLFRRVSWTRMTALAREHWHYPVYSGSSALLQSSAQMLPAVLIAILFGPAAAGWFGLGQRVTGMPARMVGEAAGQAFLAEIAHAQGPELHPLFKRTALRLLLLGLLGLAPLLLLGPPLFALIFGEPWRETGMIVQVLIPLHLARFVVTPLTQTLNVTGRQHLHLVASLLGALALLLSFALSALLDLTLLATLLLYSLSSSAAFLFHLLCAWRAAQAAETASVAALKTEATETTSTL